MPDQTTTDAASQKVISLSQALLAPLDAILKAQIHAARSFLNLVLQIGYPHQALGEDGLPVRGQEGDSVYSLKFKHEVWDGEKNVVQTTTVPALAMVPIQPLTINQADISFKLTVTEIGEHEQIQRSEQKKMGGYEESNKRPWYLVSDPISMRGHIAASSQSTAGAEVNIQLKLGQAPMPHALEKLLSTLTQVSHQHPEVSDDNAPPVVVNGGSFDL